LGSADFGGSDACLVGVGTLLSREPTTRNAGAALTTDSFYKRLGPHPLWRSTRWMSKASSRQWAVPRPAWEGLVPSYSPKRRSWCCPCPGQRARHVRQRFGLRRFHFACSAHL